MKRPHVLALGAVLALSVTACGSTVQVTSTGLANDGLGTGTQQGLDAVGGGAVSGTGGPSVPSGTGGTTVPGGSAVAPGTRDPGTGTGQVATPDAVRSTGPVRLGLLYLEGVDTAAGALGISGLSTGDARAQTQALVDHLNGRGGLGGREITLMTARVAASDAGSPAAWAAACESLTQDKKVEYVVSYVGLDENKIACYAKRGVPVVDDQSFLPDRLGAKYADFFAAPGELAPGRSATELVDALVRMGWLTSTSKVGTFVYDTPEGVETEVRYLIPALRKRGITVAASVRSPVDAGGANQSGTVVKFRSAGVDRVIPIGASPLFLMQAAESQRYRPMYAMTSGFGPGALLESAAPKAQLAGAKGIGWSKYLDIGAGTRPGPVSSNETLCFDIMRKARQQSTSATVQAFQTALCNVMFVLQAGAAKHGLTGKLFSLLRNERFAPLPADAFSIRMAPGRADGVAAFRDLAYDQGCGCFQYTSGNRATR